MNLIVPFMLFGWVPLTIILFIILKPHHAVLISVVGGWLFLPVASYNLPGLPIYNKCTAISIGLILGSIIYRPLRDAPFQWKIYDLPIVFWCLICPFATSISNQLGLYNGLSGVVNNIILYGVPYFIGRIYFNNTKALKELCVCIIIGGIIYLPLCIFEIRMSPKLHREIYGFFQHEFHQHIRYGGYRPIVFMQSGLMVSLWMAVSTTMAFWFWKTNDEKYFKDLPLSVLVVALAITTILCKSANGWTVLFIGISCYLLYIKFSAIRAFKILLCAIFIYLITRTAGLISSEVIKNVASVFFDDERILSFTARLIQEDLIIEEVMKQPYFGWGGFGRGMPVDIETGRLLVRARDSLWLITFQSNGYFGLFSLYVSLLFGPWLVLNNLKKIRCHNSSDFQTLLVALSLIIIFFSIDSLLNGMYSPLYILISGALSSFYLKASKSKRKPLKLILLTRIYDSMNNLNICFLSNEKKILFQ